MNEDEIKLEIQQKKKKIKKMINKKEKKELIEKERKALDILLKSYLND